MKNKYMGRWSIVSSTLLVSGTALAGPPIPFDQYTVNAGVITATCPAGFTCDTLDGTGIGSLMQQIKDNISGVSYVRTIIVNDNANGSVGAGLDFANESFVIAGANNNAGTSQTNNIATKQMVSDAGAMAMTATIQGGEFRDNNIPGNLDAELHLLQTVVGAGQKFEQEGLNGNVRQRIDQDLGTDAGKFTYSVVDGIFTPQTGGTLGGTTMPALNYNAGDALSVVWIGADPQGAGTAAERQFGFQKYTDWGPNANVVATDPGPVLPLATSAYLSQGPQGTFTSNGPWEWDASIFGTAPAAP